VAEGFCARLTTPAVDIAGGDRALAEMFRHSRLGSLLDGVTRAAEAAWRESRTRRALRWLQGRE